MIVLRRSWRGQKPAVGAQIDWSRAPASLILAMPFSEHHGSARDYVSGYHVNGVGTTLANTFGRTTWRPYGFNMNGGGAAGARAIEPPLLAAAKFDSTRLTIAWKQRSSTTLGGASSTTVFHNGGFGGGRLDISAPYQLAQDPNIQFVTGGGPVVMTAPARSSLLTYWHSLMASYSTGAGADARVGMALWDDGALIGSQGTCGTSPDATTLIMGGAPNAAEADYEYWYLFNEFQNGSDDSLAMQLADNPYWFFTDPRATLFTFSFAPVTTPDFVIVPTAIASTFSLPEPTITFNGPLTGDCIVRAAIDSWPDVGTQETVVRLQNTIYRGDGSGLNWVLVKDSLGDGFAPNFTLGGAEEQGRSRKVFHADGYNPVQVLAGVAGAATTDLAQPPADWTGTNQPIQIVIHDGYAFGFGNFNSPHMIYRSTRIDHEDYSDNTTYSLFPGEGERLVAGISFKGFLIVWKYPEGVYAIDTTEADPNNWRVIKVGVVGASGPGNVCAISNDVVWISPDGAWHAISATDVTGAVSASDFSYELLGTWTRENINIGKLLIAQMVYYDLKQEVMLAYHAPGEGRKHRRLHLNLARRKDLGPRWSTWDRDRNEALFMRKHEGVLIPAFGDASGQIWNLDTAERLKDGGVYDFEWYVQDKDIGDLVQGWAGRRKNLRFLQLESDPRDSGTHTVSIIRDGSIRQEIDFDLASEGATLPAILPFSLGGQTFRMSRPRRLRGQCTRLALRGTATADHSLVRFLLGFQLGD